MNEKIDMVSNPKKSFWKLSVPIIAFCVFDAIYGIVDMAWVSQISVHASFAVGISIPFVSLIFSFGDSIGQGANSLMSRFMGADDYESAYNSLIHGLILANIVWVGIVICTLFAQGIIYSLDSAHSYLLVWDYLIPIVTFAYIFIFVNVFAETLQAEGNSRIPTILIISSNILNIILDPIFIFNLNLGVKGASYATVLSSAVPFICFIVLYLSGRTKVPLSKNYFKLRPYILVEIFKVALPNFLDDGVWTFSASFINGILLMTTGEIGPILYSVSNKLKILLSAPVKGYGRALMSVTGHLFGAHKFAELNDMYKYALKISFMTTVAVMMGFIFLRDYAFSLFSINGMETEVFLIAVYGIFIMLSIPFAMISSKMLDGFGKSLYSLLFTCIRVGLEVGLIYVLSNIFSDGISVLIGITIADILIAIVYYLFLRYLFRNFDKKYENKEVVKTFKSDKESESVENAKIEDANSKRNRIIKRILLSIILIAMVTVVIDIIISSIVLNDYSTLFSVISCLGICAASFYLITKLNKPKFSLLGFALSAVIIFVFLSSYGNSYILLFVITLMFIMYIGIIIRKLRNGDS